jgi:hypothetical protein
LTINYNNEIIRNSFKKFPEIAGIIYRNCFSEKEICTDVVLHLTDAARRKRPEKERTTSWFFLYNNAPAHLSVLVKYFLPKNKVRILQQPPILSLPGSSRFCPVPTTGSSMEGTALL